MINAFARARVLCLQLALRGDMLVLVVRSVRVLAAGQAAAWLTLGSFMFASCGGTSSVRQDAAGGAAAEAGSAGGSSGAVASGGTIGGRAGRGFAGRGIGGAVGTSGRVGRGVGGTVSGGAGTPGGGDSGDGGVGGGGAAGAGESGSVGGTSAAGKPAVSGAGGDGGDGGGSTTLPIGACPSETTWLSGLQGCDEADSGAPPSFVHRPTALGCALPERNPPGEVGAAIDDSCDRDSDCLDDEYCIVSSSELELEHRCVKGCAEDADCGSGNICVCQPRQRSVEHADFTLGLCRPSTCTVDADCGDGLCRAMVRTPAHGCGGEVTTAVFSCQTPEDECSGPHECPEPTISGEEAFCGAFQGASRWICYALDPCG